MRLWCVCIWLFFFLVRGSYLICGVRTRGPSLRHDAALLTLLAHWPGSVPQPPHGTCVTYELLPRAHPNKSRPTYLPTPYPAIHSMSYKDSSTEYPPAQHPPDVACLPTGRPALCIVHRISYIVHPSVTIVERPTAPIEAKTQNCRVEGIGR
jgi:hypothetical protein